MSAKSKPLNFVTAVEDHSAEGLEILTGTSSFWARAIIYILATLLIAIVIWSFYGKADVIAAVKGRLEPESEITRVYVPTGGELIGMYVSEGIPISKGDLVARIKAAGAIRAAAQAVQAKIKLEAAEHEKKLFPQTMKLLETEIQGMKLQITQNEKDYDRLRKDEMRNLSAKQKMKLKMSKLQLKQAEKDSERAKLAAAKYKRLYATAGHGGVSQQAVEEKESIFQKADAAYQRALAARQSLELQFGSEHAQIKKALHQSKMGLLRLRLQLNGKQQQYDNSEIQLNTRHRAANAVYEAASQISFDDLDQNNFLKIFAPVSGTITDIAFTQKGEKVQPAAPLIAIAPENAKMILTVGVPDMNRGLLKVGMPVKIKFRSFPYQRYGFIAGRLEYIAPAAKLSKQGQALYKGHVSIERDYFIVNGEKIHLRYGMTAIAEIVVQERRFIDMVLAPFKKLKS